MKQKFNKIFETKKKQKTLSSIKTIIRVGHNTQFNFLHILTWKKEIQGRKINILSWLEKKELRRKKNNTKNNWKIIFLMEECYNNRV